MARFWWVAKLQTTSCTSLSRVWCGGTMSVLPAPASKFRFEDGSRRVGGLSLYSIAWGIWLNKCDCRGFRKGRWFCCRRCGIRERWVVVWHRNRSDHWHMKRPGMPIRWTKNTKWRSQVKWWESSPAWELQGIFEVWGRKKPFARSPEAIPVLWNSSNQIVTSIFMEHLKLPRPISCKCSCIEI
jgi:hypothetical protein